MLGNDARFNFCWGTGMTDFPPGICHDKWRAVPRQPDADIFQIHCTVWKFSLSSKLICTPLGWLCSWPNAVVHAVEQNQKPIIDRKALLTQSASLLSIRFITPFLRALAPEAIL
jgi:hypothetical protein